MAQGQQRTNKILAIESEREAYYDRGMRKGDRQPDSMFSYLLVEQRVPDVAPDRNGRATEAQRTQRKHTEVISLLFFEVRKKEEGKEKKESSVVSSVFPVSLWLVREAGPHRGRTASAAGESGHVGSGRAA